MQGNVAFELAQKNEDCRANLNLINGISFTNREIDVIACIVGGRASKKIAAFLLISHKTVDAHIQNILSKLRCNSRDEIIDFIEKSHHFTLIKSHYSNLLINAAFEKELRCLSMLNNNMSCLIFHYKKNKYSFIDQLEKHLGILKINIISKIWENGKSVPIIMKCAKKQPINFIIYLISIEFITQIETKNYNLNLEIANINALLKESGCSIILLLLDEMPESNTKNHLNDLAQVDFTTKKKYYFSFYELLKKLLPQIKTDKSIEEFKNQYETLHEGYQWQNIVKQQAVLPKGFIKTKKYFKAAMIAKLLTIPILVIGITTCFLNFSNVKLGSTFSKAVAFINGENLKNKIHDKIVLNLPQRNFNFTGRAQEITQIKNRLNEQNIGVVTQAIAGLGGVGKTQLATEFAYQAAVAEEYSVIFWIPAETANNIHSAYKTMAQHLQLNITEIELDSIKILVHNLLANKYKNSKVLFVLDNVPSHDVIYEYLTKLHKDLSPYITLHILITSRSQYWPESSPLILDVFSTEEALDFIKRHLPDEHGSKQQQLIKKLHSFPLALGQAVAYIKKHTNITDYLELYANKQKDYLDKFVAQNNQYTESLWKTWDISLAKLSNRAKNLLFISAYLDPDDIPFVFFDNISAEQKADCIEELRKYSFITLSKNNTSFKIHRLLQEVIRLSLKHNSQKHGNTETYWLNQTLNLINDKFDFDFMQPTKWKEWSRYLSSASIVADHAVHSSNDTLRRGIKLNIKYAMFLTYIHYDCKNVFESWNKILLSTKQNYNNKISNIIAARINTHISSVKNWAGKEHEARNLLVSTVLPTYQLPMPIKIKPKERELLDSLRIIPFKNPTIEQTRNKCDLSYALKMLANSQYQQGRLRETLTTCKQAVEILNGLEVNNINQLHKVYVLWLLDRTYIDLGQFIKAEEILDQIRGQEKIYANHPRQAHFYANSAFLMYQIGKFKEADNLLKQCSEVRRQHFSEQHIKHVDTEINQGFNNLMLGKIIAAENNFIKAEKLQTLYNNNADLSVRINLGFWKTYETLGEYDKAIDYMKKTHLAAKIRYKYHIRSKMSFLLTQADIWPKLVRIEQLKYWQEALLEYKKIFGKQHYQTAKCHYMLALHFEHMKKNGMAKKHYQQALLLLKMQKIRHPALQQSFAKNIELLQKKLLL